MELTSISTQLDYIFRPESVAVIGASNFFGKWGFRVLSRLIKTGYRGAVFPVNHREETVCGIRAYKRISDVPQKVDLAVITIPAPHVPGIMEECVQQGVKGVVLITAGFAEIGETGRKLQDDVIKIARDGGIRIVGPNCMGIWSAAGMLNLSFEKTPLTGPISFISQSGTFGGYLSEIANSKGYGLSKFVSIGNQADVRAADYLEYLAGDDQTRVIVYYMEGFKDGRRFFNLAREVTKRNPVIIFNAGKTQAGARATQSQTASLAGSETVFDAMCRQAGLIRSQEALQSFDMAEALAGQPVAPGRRIAILGSGGQGVVTADACEHLGLSVPALEKEVVAKLKEELPAHAPPPTNPVDFAGTVRTTVQEAAVVEMLLKQDSIDGVISNVPINPMAWSYASKPGKIEQPLIDLLKITIEGAETFASLPRKYNKPIVTIRFRKFENDIVTDILKGAGIPVYDTPEECARAMYALARYGEIRKAPIQIE
jgi:acetyl-CoA synthetase (ADP-forming)